MGRRSVLSPSTLHPASGLTGGRVVAVQALTLHFGARARRD